MSHLSFRRRSGAATSSRGGAARAAAGCAAGLAAVALSAAVAPPASAANVTGWYLSVTDGIVLPDRPARIFGDDVWAAPFVDGPGDYGVVPRVTVERDGREIVPVTQLSQMAGVALRRGDVFVIRNTYGRDSGPYPELLRHVYEPALSLKSACAGVTTFTGPRSRGSEHITGFSGTWTNELRVLPPIDAGNPPPPGGVVPVAAPPSVDYQPGDWWQKDAAAGKIEPVGDDQYRFDATRPLPLGATVLMSEMFTVRPGLTMRLTVERLVRECGAPDEDDATDAQKPGGGSPAPAPDKVAPAGTVTGPDRRALAKLLRPGPGDRALPLRLSSSESATVSGTVRVVVPGRRAILRREVRRDVAAGSTSVDVPLGAAARRKLRLASRSARIEVELTLTDAAGNAAKLPAWSARLRSSR